MAQAFLVDVLHSGGNVSRNAVREDETVLHHHPAPLSPLPDAVAVQWRVTQQYLPACGGIEAEQ